MIYISTWFWSKVNRGSWRIYIEDGLQNYIRNGTIYNYTAAAGEGQYDSVEWNVRLDAGTYNMKIIHSKWINGGSARFRLDGVLIGTIDMYSAIQSWRNITTFSGIVVDTPGIKTLELDAVDKHPSSGRYVVVADEIIFYRAD